MTRNDVPSFPLAGPREWSPQSNAAFVCSRHNVHRIHCTPGAVGDIIESTTNIPCPATGATITFEFSAGVVAVSASVDDALGSATVGSDGSTVVFDVSSLEDKPTLFAAVLDFCADPGGSYFAASVSYSDDEGNTPDLSSLLVFLAALPTCGEFGGECMHW